MGNRKTLQELTIKDNFMFAAVMLEQDHCKRLLELILGGPIARVEVDREKSIVYNPEYKGVRLDVFAMDAENTHYNVEMQVQTQHLEKRSRYYHSQMDMEMLLRGTTYEELPDSYVIFICDFDPFGEKKYRYTVEKHFREVQNVAYKDGSHSIFLSTRGKDPAGVPAPLVKFLDFVHAELPESTNDFEDEFIRRLQTSIAQIKSSREMGAKYMVFEEMLRDEHASGKAEGKAEGLAQGLAQGLAEGRVADILTLLEEADGTISDELYHRLQEIRDLDVLTKLVRAAGKSETVEQFEKRMNEILES
jgi:predicted transposase/invertase (TIGR01784 family)